MTMEQTFRNFYLPRRACRCQQLPKNSARMHPLARFARLSWGSAVHAAATLVMGFWPSHRNAYVCVYINICVCIYIYIYVLICVYIYITQSRIFCSLIVLWHSQLKSEYWVANTHVRIVREGVFATQFTLSSLLDTVKWIRIYTRYSQMNSYRYSQMNSYIHSIQSNEFVSIQSNEFVYTLNTVKWIRIDTVKWVRIYTRYGQMNSYRYSQMKS